MQPEETNDQAGKRKIWLIVFISSLTTLAIFWSVDSSVFYILTGFCAFSFFKVLQNRKRTEDEDPIEKTYQQTYYPKPSIWDEIKFMFSNAPSGRSQRSPGNQVKLIRLVIAIFSGLVFLSIIITILFSDDSASTADTRQKAKDMYDQQQYDSASYYYQKAIENDPENADLYLERGNSFLNADKTDSALMDYDKALLLRPSYKEAYYNKGLIYYARKQYRNSINETKHAVDIDPDYTDAMLLIGDDFYNSSQLDSAMTWYENAYSKGARSAALSHVMAYIYDTKGNTQKAIPLYKEAISYDTTRTQIYQRLGELVGGEEGNQYRQKAAQYQQR
jgi:tetratricopeptide (TPR) repeat protein